MFPVSKNRLFPYSSPLITDNYRELLFDDVPILFVGTNEAGYHIIGSLADENRKKGRERYFHIVVDESDYSDYFGRKVSYRQLLDKAAPVYVVDKFLKTDEQFIYHYKADEIPDDYKPLSDSFIPASVYKPVRMYRVPINGGIAADGRAIPKDAGETTSKIGQIINSGLATLEKYVDIVGDTFCRPATVGSYELNFEVSITRHPGLFGVDPDDCWDYLNQYIKYCLEYLPTEAMTLDGPESDSKEFTLLAEKAFRLAEKLQMNHVSKEEIKDSVLADVLETPKMLQEVAKIITKNYRSLSISNNGTPLGKIDKEFKQNLSEVSAHLLTLQTRDKVEDQDANEYYIHVYDFNKNTGGGLAYLRQPGDKHPTVRFSILDYDPPVHARKFTGSEHEGEDVAVTGKLTRIKGRPRSIEIHA